MVGCLGLIYTLFGRHGARRQTVWCPRYALAMILSGTLRGVRYSFVMSYHLLNPMGPLNRINAIGARPIVMSTRMLRARRQPAEAHGGILGQHGLTEQIPLTEIATVML